MRAKFRNFSYYHLLTLVSIFLLLGCSNVNLSKLPQTREGYNAALSQSDSEQFLLNIVRIHFGQTPYFVNVDSMVTQSSLTTASGSSNLTSNPYNFTNTGPFWSLNPVISFTQTPTISYSPLQGTQFVSGMLTPINMEKLSLLLQSGWSTSEVLKLTTERIGTFINGTSALHVLPAVFPKQDEFNQLISLLDRLDVDDRIEYTTTTYNDRKAVVINVMDKAAEQQLATALHLSKPYNQILLSRAVPPNATNGPENIIFIQTRSFFSMLNFLSNGVVIGDEKYNKEYGIHEEITHNNKTYLLSRLTQGLLVVKTGNKAPKNAFAKIEFEGRWFWIPHQDAISKATLVLLRVIYALQLGDLKANMPLVTIPIGR